MQKQWNQKGLRPEGVDFNFKLEFKADKESTDDVLVIEGYANFSGKISDDYSQVYIDRANEVVVPSGMDVAEFKKNPVILLNHDRGEVIGKAVTVTKKADGIYLKAEIHKGACKPEIFYAIQNGLIKTFSVGFRSIKGEWKEVGKRDVYFITKSALREVSCVTIPANAESVFEVKALTEGGGIWADVAELSPTTKTVDINKQDGEENMQIPIIELMNAGEAEKLKASGFDATQTVEISQRQYIDLVVQKAVENALVKLKLQEQEAAKGEEESGSEKGSEGITDNDGDANSGEDAGKGTSEGEGSAEGEIHEGGEDEGKGEGEALSDEEKAALEETLKSLKEAIQTNKPAEGAAE